MTYRTLGSRIEMEVDVANAKLYAELEVPEWTYDGPKKPHSWSDVVQGEKARGSG